MKRFINFRPLCYVFLTFAAAVFCVIKVFLNDFLPISIFGLIIATLSIFGVISFFKKNFLKGIFERFGIKSLRAFCLLILITAIVGSAISATAFALCNARPMENGNYQITAKVKEIVEFEDKCTMLLGNVEIDGKRQNFNIQASTQNQNVTVGDELTFKGYLSKINLINQNKINTTILKTNTKYYCHIDDTTLQITFANGTLTDNVKAKTKTILQENMTDENSGFAYAILIGDKSILSEEYYDMFKSAGLAHVLAVSGLHIGFLVAMLQLILTLCKVKNKSKFFVTLAILVIYNIICNFSPSVFRASVMSLCLMLGLLLGERNDQLSNISLAGIIVLTVQPLFLFDVGFLLSFSSVFGILLLQKPISLGLQKIKLPKLLVAPIALTISATLGSLPFVCRYFGEYAPISILSNLLILPIFSLMFAVLIICVFINFLVNLPILISFSQFFVNIITNLSAIFAKAGTIKTISFDLISIFISAIFTFIASPYFMIKAKNKLICLLALAVCISGTLSVNNLSYKNYENAITTTKGESNSLLFTTSNGVNILSGIDGSKYHFLTTKSMLKEKQVKQIDYILLFNYSMSAQDDVVEIAISYNAKNVFVFGEYDNTTKIGLTTALFAAQNVQFTNSLMFEIDNFSFERFVSSSKTKAISYNLGDIKLMHILQGITEKQISQNSNFFLIKPFDYCISNTLYDRYFVINSKIFLTRECNISKQSKQVYVMGNGILWTSK